MALFLAAVATTLLPDDPRGTALMTLVPLASGLAFFQPGRAAGRRQSGRTRVMALATLAASVAAGFRLMVLLPAPAVSTLGPGFAALTRRA